MATVYDDKWIKNQYSRLNRAYFHDELPPNLPVKFAKTRDVWAAVTIFGAENGQASEILVDFGLKKYPRYAKMVLIHEMAHVAVGTKEKSYHGQLWKTERKRLIDAGAFTQLL